MPLKPAKNPVARAATVLAHDMLSEVEALLPHLDGLTRHAYTDPAALSEVERVAAGLRMLRAQAQAVIARNGKPDAETEPYTEFVEDLGLDWLTVLPGGNVYVDPESGCAYVEALVRVEDDEVMDAEDEDEDDLDDEDEDDLDDEDEDEDDLDDEE